MTLFTISLLDPNTRQVAYEVSHKVLANSENDAVLEFKRAYGTSVREGRSVTWRWTSNWIVVADVV